MAIFKIQNQKLLDVKEKTIDLEKDIQNLTEKNLESVFHLHFVCSEFAIKNSRIDTLAFDKETKAFVIIEYKRNSSFSVIDQGFAYLALMLNNKADFVLEYNEKNKESLKRNEIDWTQSRVLLLAQSFTTHQQNAINFRDLPIELWEVKIYDNSTILYSQLQPSEAKVSINAIKNNKTVATVVNQVKVYTVEDHVDKVDSKVKTVFEELREKLFSLGSDVKENPKKQYVAYKAGTNFVDLIFNKKDIRVILNLRAGNLIDPQKKATDLTNPSKGHWGNGDYEIKLQKVDEIPYAMGLIEQSYRYQSSR